MTLPERMFALRGLPGFDQLRADELLAVAAGMTERRYRPGQVVAAADTSLWHLLVVVAGHVLPQGVSEPMPPIIGADLLITNRALAVTLVADPREGAVCLRLGKGHFFTVVNECPALLVEMIRLHSPGAQGQAR
jgi:hypothetical protein